MSGYTKFRLLYNLRENFPYDSEQQSMDISADWDIPETIELLSNGLRNIGLEIEEVEVGYPFNLDILKTNQPIISICEMKGGPFRESLIPSACELLDIPYLFSTPDVMHLTLDKNLCNYLVKSFGINVPNWHMVTSQNKDSFYKDLKNYPYIVKPSHEGSGIGISNDSVVESLEALKQQIEQIFSIYQQPVMVQEYIAGHEVTIGVIGDGTSTTPLTPIEMDLKGNKVYGHHAKENSASQIIVQAMDNGKQYLEVQRNAKEVHSLLGCKDCSRIDFRVNQDGQLFFIEINPLPHLHPVIGDFCRSGIASGYSYEELLKNVVSRLAGVL